MHSRRDIVRRGATVGLAATGLVGAATAPAAADHEDGEWRAKPRDVTIEYDQPWLEQYEPRLLTDRETRDRFIGLYAYAVRGDGYDYDVACYWAQLTHQDGVSFLGLFEADSHLGDHEPVYVYVEPDTGEIDRVVYSTYHHFPGEVTPSTARVVQDRHPDHDTHVVLRVSNKWHNYSAAIDSDATGAFLGLEDWVSVRDSWLEHGFYEETADEAIEDPETMRTRKAWWDDDTRDYKYGELAHRVGLRGAEQSDEIR